MSKSSELDKVVKSYILDCISADGYDATPTTDAEKVAFLYNCFTSEYQHEIDRRGEILAFKEWISGLPSTFNIDFCNNDILDRSIQWGSIPADATESQEYKILENWFLFIANKTLQLFRKYKEV